VAEFDRLRQTKGLKNIGRADLLIAQRHRLSPFFFAHFTNWVAGL
jgi:hypothetical protein